MRESLRETECPLRSFQKKLLANAIFSYLLTTVKKSSTVMLLMHLCKLLLVVAILYLAHSTLHVNILHEPCSHGNSPCKTNRMLQNEKPTDIKYMQISSTSNIFKFLHCMIRDSYGVESHL